MVTRNTRTVWIFSRTANGPENTRRNTTRSRLRGYRMSNADPAARRVGWLRHLRASRGSQTREDFSADKTNADPAFPQKGAIFVYVPQLTPPKVSGRRKGNGTAQRARNNFQNHCNTARAAVRALEARSSSPIFSRARVVPTTVFS